MLGQDPLARTSWCLHAVLHTWPGLDGLNMFDVMQAMPGGDSCTKPCKISQTAYSLGIQTLKLNNKKRHHTKKHIALVARHTAELGKRTRITFLLALSINCGRGRQSLIYARAIFKADPGLCFHGVLTLTQQYDTGSTQPARGRPIAAKACEPAESAMCCCSMFGTRSTLQRI